MIRDISAKYTSLHSGRIIRMDHSSHKSDSSAQARDIQRGLQLEVYLPVCLAGLSAIIGAAALAYGAFAGRINHGLLADTVLILIMAPALLIGILGLVTILALVVVLSRTSDGITALLRNGERISANVNSTAWHYSNTAEAQVKRIHRVTETPARILSHLREKVRRLYR